MKKSGIRSYIAWISISLGVGILASLLTSEGIEFYNNVFQKPSLAPPPITFPIVWTVLYVLMGIGAARIYVSPESTDRTKGINLFISQLIVNFFWSLIFFNAQAFFAAFVWLLVLFVLIIWMTVTFYKVDKPAALLQIPYIIWVTFAGYLNFMIWQLNA